MKLLPFGEISPVKPVRFEQDYYSLTQLQGRIIMDEKVDME
jgi:hypothetical protein